LPTFSVNHSGATSCRIELHHLVEPIVAFRMTSSAGRMKTDRGKEK